MMYFPFTIDYQKLVRRLSFPVRITNPDSMICKEYSATVDTGATSSVITSEIFESLHLIPTDRKDVIAVNSRTTVPVAVVNMTLPNGLTFTECRVAICDISGKVDVLIGMDIIVQGDFAISNYGQKTLLSYCAPSQPNKIDFARCPIGGYYAN